MTEMTEQSPGRGPGGKPRNFRAMNDAKLATVIVQLRDYAGDAEALALAEAVAVSRFLRSQS